MTAPAVEPVGGGAGAGAVDGAAVLSTAAANAHAAGTVETTASTAPAVLVDLNSGDVDVHVAIDNASASASVPAPATEVLAGMTSFDRHAYYVTGRRIVLWRHGQTAWNLEGRLQGQTDVPLDAVGQRQAQTMARLLASLDPSVIVSSDLSRAVETARALADLVRLEVVLDEGLRETFVGTWQGLTDAEIRERFPEEYAAWRKDHHQRRGGGEIESEVADRAVAAIERALKLVPDRGTLVVVTHGGTARVSIARLLGLPEQSTGVLGGLSNCCWSVLGEGHRGWRLLEHNAGSLPEPVFGDDR